MKKIWAPWRLEYILKSSKSVSESSQKKKICVFCQVQKSGVNARNLVLFKGKTAYVIMNKYPYTNGHLMVIPNQHVSDFSKLSPEEHSEMGHLMKISMVVLKKVFRAQGFNVGMNLGDVAGAGIKEHLHYHIVPRWAGDHNCMPVVAGVRILIEHLKKTHQRLVSEFNRYKKK